MTSGYSFYDRRYQKPGYVGLSGHTTERTWNGTDSPKVETPRRKRWRYKTSVFSVNRFGRQVTVSRTSSFPDMSGARPAKRSRSQENPYSMTLVRRQHGEFTTFESTPRDFTTQGAGYSCEAIHGDLSVPALAVLGRLRTAIAGSDFNLGVTLGESREAFRMIGDSATKIYKALRHAKQGRWIEARRVLVRSTHWDTKQDERAWKSVYVRPGRDVSQNWLELQYGWLPLLKDVENAAQFLAHHYNVPQQNVVRATSVYRQTLSTTASGPVTPLKVVSLQKVTIKAILREKNVAQLAGVTDPLSVIWELTPYSFVADWFIPIGNWLQARALRDSIEGLFVTSSKSIATVQGMKSGVSWHPDIPGWENHSVAFSRAVSTSLAVPLPSFKPLGKVASVRHVANAVALLVGVGGTKSLKSE